MIPDALYEYMRSLGFDPPVLTPDSKLVRFGPKKSSWAVLHSWNARDGAMHYVVCFGDWHNSETVHKFSTFDGKNTEDRRHYDLQIKEAQDKANREQEKVYAETAEFTKGYLETLKVGTTEYIALKRLQSSHGALVDGANLVVPVGEPPVGYQTIAPDGTKRFKYGTRKKGNYFRIPGVGRTWLVEGFATGATVHEATGETVIVCFDAGNVPVVREKFQKSEIAGDSDEAGRKCGPGYYPPVEGMDWNDYAVANGLDAVSKLLREEPKEFVRPLGYFDDIYYYTSSSNKQIVPMSAAQHTDKHFLNLMPKAYWDARYSGSKNPYTDATTHLMELCRAVGKFRPTHVRGTGVWWDNGPVINTGDGLFPSRHSDEYTYVLAEDVPTPGEPSDPGLLIDIVNSLAWKNPEHAKIFLGWLAVAPFCGLLDWRPHVWLTGDSGTGKSTIMQNIINPVLGKYKLYLKGNTTEAGIRQRLSNSALPIIFDEFEQTGEKSDERNKTIMDLFRNASFESDGEILKGSAGGKSIQYNPVFCALVSSIRVNLNGAADTSRFTVLDLEKPDKAKYPELVRNMDLLTPEYCRGIFSHMWNRISGIRDVSRKYYSMVSANQGQRTAQQYSVLMAGYEMLTGRECTYEFKDRAETKDHVECLNHLTESIIHVEISKVRLDRSVQECFDYLMTKGDTSERVEYLAALERNGIKVVNNEKESSIYIASGHKELRKAFAGTRWAGAWRKSLERIDGAEYPSYPKFGGKTVICVKIPGCEVVDI